MNCFSDINNLLIYEIIKEINIDINELSELKNYNLIITGSVGAGKSTISEILSNILELKCGINVKKYTEYLNSEKISKKLFELRMNNVISALTFQNFILDIWEKNLIKNEFGNTNINIFERLPYDSVKCFALENLNNGLLTDDEYKILEKHYQHIIEKYNVPEYKNCECCVVYNDILSKTINDIIKIIISDLKNGIKNRSICLKINNDEYIKRIGIRNRKGEDKFELKTLNNFNNFYNELFN